MLSELLGLPPLEVSEARVKVTPDSVIVTICRGWAPVVAACKVTVGTRVPRARSASNGGSARFTPKVTATVLKAGAPVPRLTFQLHVFRSIQLACRSSVDSPGMPGTSMKIGSPGAAFAGCSNAARRTLVTLQGLSHDFGQYGLCGTNWYTLD